MVKPLRCKFDKKKEAPKCHTEKYKNITVTNMLFSITGENPGTEGKVRPNVKWTMFLF